MIRGLVVQSRVSPWLIAVLIAATAELSCTPSEAPAGAPNSAATASAPGATAPVPTQAPASGDDEDGPPSGTLAFDCPRPDGSGIVFCLGTPGGQLQPVVSPPLKQLDGGACCAEWSPDGQRVLVRLGQSVGTLQRDDVGMVNADGSGLVNLTNRPEDGNWGATWSPDGRRIVFNSGSRLFVVNADGSNLKKITRIWGEYPSWSPDGELIAFQSNRCNCNGVGGEAEYDIYTVHPDGTGLRRLTSWPGEEYVAGWSPDGRLIAYGRNPDRWPGIWIMSRRGQQVKRLEPTAPLGIYLRGVEEWAPDGSFIMSANNGEDPQTSTPSDYWVSANGRSTRLLHSGTGGATWRPSGDGKVLTHTRSRLGDRTMLGTGARDTSHPRHLFSSRDAPSSPRYRPST